MKNTIVTFLFCALSALFILPAYAWQNTIINNTDGEILITIDYAGAGICSPANRIVAPKSIVNVDSGICCAQTVTAKVTSGTRTGKTYSIATPRAGLDMTCANFTVTVENSTVGGDIIATANLN